MYFAPANIAILAVSASNTVPAPITISSLHSYIFANSFIISAAYLLVNVISKPFTFPFTHALAISTPTSFVFPRTTATTPQSTQDFNIFIFFITFPPINFHIQKYI